MALLGSRDTMMVSGALAAGSIASIGLSVAQSAHVVDTGVGGTALLFAGVGAGAAAFGASFLDKL